MKNIILILISLFLLSSCTTQKGYNYKKHNQKAQHYKKNNEKGKYMKCKKYK